MFEASTRRHEETKEGAKAARARLAIVLSLTLLWAAHAAAQFPERTVRLLVGFGAGGGTDVSARMIAKSLTETWGRSVVVENRPGADASIATAEIARAKPDGYNLLITTTAIAITPFQQKQNWDPQASFEPVTLIGSSHSLVVVHPSLPVLSVKQLIALARARPGAITYGSSGTGTVPYLATELFQMETGTRMVHVPYKGSGPASIGILSGETQLLFAAILSVLPSAKAGRLRAIAVTSPKRNPLVPEVPTLAESGLPGFDTATWYGAFAPAKTPKEIVMKLNEDLVKAIRSPEVRTNLEQQGYAVEGSSPGELAQLVKSDLVKWSRVIKAIK
jgi:tripartite-type tricarboxylate transporter receptor subunit TctC